MKFNKYLKHINIVIQILLIIFTLTFSKQEFCPNSCSGTTNKIKKHVKIHFIFRSFEERSIANSASALI